MSSVVSRRVELGKVVDYDRLSIFRYEPTGNCSLRMRSAFSCFRLLAKDIIVRIVLDTTLALFLAE